MTDYFKQINLAAENIRRQIKLPISSGLILGSGLSDLATQFEILHRIPYASIAGLPKPTAPSHQGNLLIARTKNSQHTVAICQGRIHLYEGHSAQQVVMLVYILAELGATQLFITNAAGALNPNYKPGSVMLINDHINLTGHNPLIGSDDTFANRFVDMSQAYSPLMQQKALGAAQELAIPLEHGIYVGVTGPSLETSAERRFFRSSGADAVGMSTVLEVIAARHCDMQVLALSAITNMAVGDENQQVDSIEQVLHYADLAGQSIMQIVRKLL